MATTTGVTAGEVMDRVAILLNDPAKTDYTYVVMLPYLHMAIDELLENLEESNAPSSNQSSAHVFYSIILEVGQNMVTPTEHPIGPHYPGDLVEIQEIGERLAGSQDLFIRMDRKELIKSFPAGSSFLVWSWERNIIRFNPNGATSRREIEIRYITFAAGLIANETFAIPIINCRSYLAFKTAALCSFYIGENDTRAGVLEGMATKALERLEGINNKGKQQVMTRHRPFRASYKSRGGF